MVLVNHSFLQREIQSPNSAWEGLKAAGSAVSGRDYGQRDEAAGRELAATAGGNAIMRGVLAAAYNDDPPITGQAKKATYQRKEHRCLQGEWWRRSRRPCASKDGGGGGGGGGGGLPKRMRGWSMVG